MNTKGCGFRIGQGPPSKSTMGYSLQVRCYHLVLLWFSTLVNFFTQGTRQLQLLVLESLWWHSPLCMPVPCPGGSGTSSWIWDFGYLTTFRFVQLRTLGSHRDSDNSVSRKPLISQYKTGINMMSSLSLMLSSGVSIAAWPQKRLLVASPGCTVSPWLHKGSRGLSPLFQIVCNTRASCLQSHSVRLYFLHCLHCLPFALPVPFLASPAAALSFHLFAALPAPFPCLALSLPPVPKSG